MATNSQYSTTTRNASLNAIATLANSGYLRIYDGAQPANADTAITTQNLLAELRLNATAFGAAASSVITANAITSGTAAATGTAAWFRAVIAADGVTVVFDGSVGTASANLILNSLAIQQNATVSVSSLTLTGAAAGT